MAKFSDRYKNNAYLPRAGAKKTYTAHEVQELERCMNDIVYFSQYFNIVTIDHGIQPMKLFPYQREAIEEYQAGKNLILCQSRQSGKTTAICVIILHTVIFNSHKLAMILSNKGATSRKILRQIKLAYELLPEFLKPGVKEWNKSAVEFENGSQIKAEATSSDAIRGETVTGILYIDEMGFVENWADFSASVLPTLSSGKSARLVLSSTPNGYNDFYDYVLAAREKRSSFKLIEVPWHRVPGRDEAWKKKIIEDDLKGDLQKFAQEFDLEFLGTRGTLLSGSALQRLRAANPIMQDQHTRQYEAPQGNHIYVLVADTSRGKGLDYSAFSVIDVSVEPYRQVFTYRNNFITPTDYALIIERVARLYHNAFVLAEINDLGQQVIDVLYDNDYENIMYTANHGRSGKIASGGFSAGAERGIRTTAPVKLRGCNLLKLLIEQNQLLVQDKETINEFTTFSAKGRSYQAENGKHDDLVMGLVLFAWLSMQQLFKDLTDTDALKRLRDISDEQIEEDLVPFGFVQGAADVGIEVEEPFTLAVNSDNWLFHV